MLFSSRTLQFAFIYMSFYISQPLSCKKIQQAKCFHHQIAGICSTQGLYPKLSLLLQYVTSALKALNVSQKLCSTVEFLFSFRFSTVTREDDFSPLIFIHLNSASALGWLVTFMRDYECSHTAKGHNLTKWTTIINLGLRLATEMPKHDATRLCSEL